MNNKVCANFTGNGESCFGALEFWALCVRERARTRGPEGLTLAAMPVLSPISPNKICSVPTKLWPRRLASSCANMTTLIAFSVNRSNIIRVVLLRLTDLFFLLPGFCTAADKPVGRKGWPTSTQESCLNPVKVDKTTGCRKLRLLLNLGAERTLQVELRPAKALWPILSTIINLTMCKWSRACHSVWCSKPHTRDNTTTNGGSFPQRASRNVGRVLRAFVASWLYSLSISQQKRFKMWFEHLNVSVSNFLCLTPVPAITPNGA